MSFPMITVLFSFSILEYNVVILLVGSFDGDKMHSIKGDAQGEIWCARRKMACKAGNVEYIVFIDVKGIDEWQRNNQSKWKTKE